MAPNVELFFLTFQQYCRITHFLFERFAGMSTPPMTGLQSSTWLRLLIYSLSLLACADLQTDSRRPVICS